jgi:hypothetical protein
MDLLKTELRHKAYQEAKAVLKWLWDKKSKSDKSIIADIKNLII